MNNKAYDAIKKAGKLPSPSGVALELLRLVDDDSATIAKITATVEADPATASRLLKIVNSPLSGASRKVASVSMAVKLLGLQAVKNLALGFSLLSANRKGESKAFDFEQYWSESLARAAAARNLVDHFHCCPPDEAFTLALLSQIGRLALATAAPDTYDAVMEQVGVCSMSVLAEAERKTFHIDHNHLTAEMLTDWRLPEIFCEAARRQDSSVRTTPDDDCRVAKIAGLLHLAGRVAAVLAGSSVFQEDLTALMKTADGFGLTAKDFTDRFESLKEAWPDVAAIFSVRVGPAPSLREVHTRASRHGGSVLVVDDDASVRMLLTKYLADAGYDVLTASSGTDALRLIHSEGCQLIITDWKMPNMDGLQLCRAIRKSEGVGFAYVIFYTGQTNTESLDKAFEAGADDFLTKPCQRQELLSRLKAGVRVKAAEAKLAAQQRAIYKSNAELTALNDKLREMATTDELTGLYNRREAMSRLEAHWAAAGRQDRPLACMLLDIDHFKRCNDTHGHDLGDVVLRETAQVLKRTARTGETVFRIGGEEFVVLCPGATAEKTAVGAERLRAAVEAHRVEKGETTLGVTISVGVAERGSETDTPDDLLKLADEALYEAKRSGRNRVCVACGDGSTVPPPAVPGSDVVGQTPVRTLVDDENAPGTVLVVDDSPASRRLLRRLLETDGFQVQEACDGMDALAKAAALHPNVILMDVEMPRMGGLDCTRQLKATPPLSDIPIIIVSGHTGSQQVRAGLEAGAQEYIAKPIQHDEFLLRVRAMSQLQRGRAALLQSNAVRGEQARALGILFDFSCSLTLADSLDKIVDSAATTTAELINSHRVSVMLPDDAGKNLYVASAIGIDDEFAAKIRVPVGSAIAGQVFASGAPVVVNSPGDALDRTGRYDSDFFASIPLASKALAVPGKVVGVLNVTERHDRRPFETHEIEYLDLICNMTASALDQFQSARAQEHAHSAIVIGLAKLAEHRDACTGKHLERVTQFALLLAGELRNSPQHASTIDDRFLKHLQQAMPLHDIGKVAIPDSVLLKPGQLTEAEFAAMKRHTVVGTDAIQSVIEQAPEAGFLEMARDITHCHHERFDGAGYPRGLAGDDIPLAARIAAVADVYDAVTSERPYKKALHHNKAVRIIRESSGSHFDPTVVDAFLRREGEFANSAAKLSDEMHTEADAEATEELVACSSGGPNSP